MTTEDGTSFPPHFLAPKRKGLGRGLASLFEGQEGAVEHEGTPLGELQYLSPEEIVLGKYQPRLHFREDELEELAQSVREKGVLQPILVRRSGQQIELVAGERRLRASRIAGLAQIPCRVLDVSPDEAFEIALLENIQRADLSPIEEARGYRQLLDMCGYTQEILSQKLGKSRAYMTNMLRLLTLPLEVQNFVEKGELSAGHARALVNVEDPIGFARLVIQKGLSVRGTESLARGGKIPLRKPRREAEFSLGEETEEAALSQQLTDLTGLRINIQLKASGGVIQVGFKTPLELDAFLEKLTRSYLEPTYRSFPN